MSSGTAPTPFQPPNQAGAASSLQGAATSLTSLGNTTTGTAVPGYQSIYQNTTSNPYYSQAQTGAGQTAQTGGQFGQSEVNNAYGLQALGNSLGQYAPGIAATAFDPQNQLYNQQQQVNNQQQNAINAQNGVAGSPFGAGLAGESNQNFNINWQNNQQQQVNNQQQNAINAQNGVAGSPFGAGLAGESNQNFNINWQNNQQQRENAGVAALGSLAQTQSGLQTAAGDLGTSGLNTMYASSQLPSQTYLGQQSADTNALNSLVSGDVQSGSPFSSAGALDTSYLGIGQQASQNALASWQAQQNADNAFWKGIGTLASDAGGIASDFAGL